jgi:hypothetical protein
MRNRRLLQAPQAAFTGHEKNSRAQLFELLSDEFALRCPIPCLSAAAISDAMSLLYSDNARGRDVISGHAPRQYPKPDPSDRASLPTE